MRIMTQSRQQLKPTRLSEAQWCTGKYGYGSPETGDAREPSVG
jgi:hypothetical protein